MKKLFYVLALFGLLVSCSEEGTSNEKLKAVKKLITKENYTEGEVLVVVDTSYWNKDLGKSIKEGLANHLYGMPQPEPHFIVRRIDPADFKGSFKKFNNILFVGNVNSNSSSSKYLKGILGKENAQRVVNDKKKPFFVASDVFTRGQNIIYILGTSDEEVLQKVNNSIGKIKYYIDAKVSQQLIDRYNIATKYNKEATEICKEKLDLNLHIPVGFKKAREEKDLLWYRFPDREVDKNIVISCQDYVSESQFSDSSIAAWRDSLGSNYIKEGNDSLYYMMTSTYVPLKCENNADNNGYSRLCRGLWKLKDESLGGPFVSYVVLNKEQTKIYYIEGFVIAPSKAKRKYIREMRTYITSVRF